MSTINEQIVTGRKFRKLIDEVNKIWQRISFWTKASDVEFDDGYTAETKVGAIKGITTDLNTTKTGYAADMTVFAQLYSDISIRYNAETDYIQVHNGSEWINWIAAGLTWDGFLYNYGDLCAPVTGGWIPSSTWSGGYIEYRATAILFSMVNHDGTVIGSASIMTNKAKTIPVKYTKIKASYDVAQLMGYALSASVELAICNDQGAVLSTREATLTTFGIGQIIEIPLGSNQLLPLRVRLSVKQNAGYDTYVTVTKIWAE